MKSSVIHGIIVVGNGIFLDINRRHCKIFYILDPNRIWPSLSDLNATIIFFISMLPTKTAELLLPRGKHLAPKKGGDFITALLCKAGTGSSIEIVFDRSQWYDCIYCFNYISVVTVSLMLHITIIYLILYHQGAIGLIGIT